MNDKTEDEKRRDRWHQLLRWTEAASLNELALARDLLTVRVKTRMQQKGKADA